AGGNDATDSDADTATGRTATTTLVSGENDTTWDAGMYQYASIGDRVWLDLNGNGVQDGGESGVANIPVTLYTGGGAFVASTTTNGTGFYQFNNLVPGDYYVDFDLIGDYQFTTPNAGADDTADS